MAFAIPTLRIADYSAARQFYVDGLGFRILRSSVPFFDGPKLELLQISRRYDLSLQLRVVTQIRWNEDPSLLVDIEVLGRMQVYLLERDRLRAEGRLFCQALLERLPFGKRVDVQAYRLGVEGLGNDDGVAALPGQHLAKAGRDRYPALVVDVVMKGSSKHGSTKSRWPAHYRAASPGIPRHQNLFWESPFSPSRHLKWCRVGFYPIIPHLVNNFPHNLTCVANS